MAGDKKSERQVMQLAKLFSTFFKIGAVTIGGGTAMIPVIRKEFVEKQKWTDDEKIVDILAVSQSLPGVIAVNSSMYLGYEIAGVPGLISASLGVIMPSFMLLLAIALFMPDIGSNILLSKFFAGVRAAVVPLIFLSAYKMSKSVMKDAFCWALCCAALLATLFLKLDIAFIVFAGGAAGYLYYRFVVGEIKK